MDVTIRFVSGEAMTAHVEPSQTVLSLKEQIQAQRGDACAVARQKLIHAGKVLKDESTLAEVGLKEGGFIVCMVTGAAKPAAAPAPAPAAAAAAATPAAAAPAAAAPAAAPVPASSPTAAPAAAPSAEFEAGVAQLKDMGFAESDVRAALAAAQGNTSRAVDFLMSGSIPEVPASRPAAPAVGGGDAEDMLGALRSHPQINQMRRLVQSNPAAINGLLAQINAQNPSLFAAISAHQSEFMDILNEPPTDDDDEGGDMEMDDEEEEGGVADQLAGLASALASMTPEQQAAMAASLGIPQDQIRQLAALGAALPPGGGGRPGGVPPGAAVVRLTEDEMAAVQRLEGLGFSRQQAVEAYLACDKNEELAANFLFENMS